MATLQELEVALVNAHKAGDSDAARKLAAFVVEARKDQSNQIPGAQVQGSTPQALEPSLTDKAVGVGETALTLATGATGGAAGMVAGTAKGLVDSITSGQFGTPEGVRNVEQAAAKGMESLTYQPRTQAGQEMASTAGQAINNFVPIMPMTGELNALHAAVAPVTQAARDLTTPAIARIQKVAPVIAERVQRTLSRNPESAPTPGTMASGGSAGTDMALQRRQLASDLPVPIELTKGQAERSFEQQQFEREIAKDPERGVSLRQRFSEQNEAMLKNMDAWFDQTGADAPSLRAVGKVVDEALVKKAARDKTEINVAYKKAEKSEESLAPVDPAEKVTIGSGEDAITSSVIDYLNSKPTGLKTTAMTDHAKQYAVKLGVAEVADDGTLIPRQTNVKTMEAFRKEINEATGYEPVEIRDATILKGLIDSITEPVAGPLYRNARRLRENYAKQYEDRAVIAKILNEKKGMADRQVALEDIFHHTILKGSRDDAAYVRRVLQTGGEDGQQAWRELQGSTINWIKEEATKSVTTDERGNPIISASALNKAIRELDGTGGNDSKLTLLFGKRGAQALRDLNDLSKAVYTTLPNAVNHSNTASIILAALDMIVSGFTGMPTPVASGLRLLAKRVKNRRIQKRVEEALGKAHRTADAKKAVATKTPYEKKTLH